jgi:hypothetical protein
MRFGNPHRLETSDHEPSTEPESSPRKELDQNLGMYHSESRQVTMGKGLSPFKRNVLSHEAELVNDFQLIEPLHREEPEDIHDDHLAQQPMPTPWLKNIIYFCLAACATAFYLIIVWAVHLLQQLPGGLIVWGTIGGCLGMATAISCFRLLRLWQTLPTQKGEKLEKHLRQKNARKTEDVTADIQAWLNEHQKNLRDLQHPLRQLYKKHQVSIDASIVAIDLALLDLEERPELWHKELSKRDNSPNVTMDQLAKAIILSHAKHLGLKTAALPKGWLDTLAVIWNLTDLCRELGLLYGIRTGKTDTFKLLFLGLQHILLASQLDDLDQHIVHAWTGPEAVADGGVSAGTDASADAAGSSVGEFLSQSDGLQTLLGSLLGTFVGKALEGTANALLCMRFGFALKKILSR